MPLQLLVVPANDNHGNVFKAGTSFAPIKPPSGALDQAV